MFLWKGRFRLFIKTIVVTFFAQTITTEYSFSQEISFSQHFANSLYYNPAFAGARVCPNLFFTYLNRYPGLSETGNIGGVSYDAYMHRLRGGLGTKFYYENQGGIFSNITLGVAYAYRATFSEDIFLNAGGEITYYNRNIDPSKLVFKDQYDRITNQVVSATQESFEFRSINFADVSIGLLLSTKSSFLGASAKNLIRPNNSFLNSESRLPMILTFQAGTSFSIKSKKTYISSLEITPNILYQNSDGINFYNIGLYLTRLPIVTGVWYKYDNAFVFLAGFQLEKFSIGYSYDLLTNDLAQNSYGSHEITLRLNFKCFREKRKLNSVKCPVF